MILRILLIIAIVFVSTSSSSYAQSQDDLRIWNEFIHILRNGKLPADKIRPHRELGDEFKQQIIGYLDSVRTQAAPEDWTTQPEIIHSDNRVQYILPLSTRGQKVSYCFSFITENNQWYFQHLEAIFIRLDKTPQPPTSEFADVSDAQKNWAREEMYWSFVVTNFYLPLEKEKGREYALSMLKDGGGYFVGAKTWVPFVAPHKAFILYLCWEQAKLRGNEVTLTRLDDTEAIIKLNTHFFAVYFTATHLKANVSLDEYKRIFETIWQDRASHASWKLEIKYSEDYKVTFIFRRTI